MVRSKIKSLPSSLKGCKVLWKPLRNIKISLEFKQMILTYYSKNRDTRSIFLFPKTICLKQVHFEIYDAQNLIYILFMNKGWLNGNKQIPYPKFRRAKNELNGVSTSYSALRTLLGGVYTPSSLPRRLLGQWTVLSVHNVFWKSPIGFLVHQKFRKLNPSDQK